MSLTGLHSPSRRNSPFARNSATPSPAPQAAPARPRSAIFSSPVTTPTASSSHSKHHSISAGTTFSLQTPSHVRNGSTSSGRGSAPPGSGTFAPKFIKSDEMQKGADAVRGLEGDNDFSGKRYVWLKDPVKAFVRGSVEEELDNGRILVHCDDGSQREVHEHEVDKVNPAKFDKADDMAELTHLNEPSVVHNLHMRYQSDLIYTYSGLFLVTVNPYCPLPIYTNEYVRMYKGQSREEARPHIFAMADLAFRRLVEEGENQSILVTGESGAGKTENTKKVIQYLAAVASSDTASGRSPSKQFSNLSQQILRANPILEAFGNAQTVRNNNSSRFGKFIRIEFGKSGQIVGAFIEWYLLEKSRVVKLNNNERNYHVFYQLLRGAGQRFKDTLLLADLDVEDFAYTRAGNDSIAGVSDEEEWNSLIEAFNVMKFTEQDQISILRTVAAVLYLGNIAVLNQARADQASLAPEAAAQVKKACQLLGIPADAFVKGLLHPRVKAGREWVEKVQTPEQVRLALDALAKGIYERGFGDLVTRINEQLDRSGGGSDDSHFIGVLDIAGFEIFETNSFEQLCINYTNEKLQQFFNHHMFVLEQEEYAREEIEWQFIDFGQGLQPTINLIELPNPIGIFSCLDEDSVMPKATDKSFTEKLHSLWDRKSDKYRASRLNQGFILTHYAAEVEYSTEGWLEKNKDPLNDNLTRLLSESTDKHIAHLFADCADQDEDSGPSRRSVKKGLFRTVAQRHKEQLTSLMNQLNSTHPHFVRCILPNHKKKPKVFDTPLVLDQLRCNGVLEGIRIARSGFPNRLPFAEFRSRYEVLCKSMPRGYLEGRTAAQIILEKIELDKALYRVGRTKVFFRAGVLAVLEERRDSLIREVMTRFQSVARGFVARRTANKRLYRAEATRIIQRNFRVYLDLRDSPWWGLFTGMKPLLGATRTATEVKKRDEKIQSLESKIKDNAQERQRIEDERRKALTEAHRIQQTLESERALFLDKEEIFKRLQHREMELTEQLHELHQTAGQSKEKDDIIADLQAELDQLSGAMQQMEVECSQARDEIKRLQRELEAERSNVKIDEESLKRLQNREAELSQKLSDAILDQENLEDQIDELIKAKKRIEQDLDVRKTQLEKAGTIIARFEAEKDELRRSRSAQDHELREAKMDLRELKQVMEKEGLSRNQFFQEIARRRAQLDRANENIAKLEHDAQETKRRTSGQEAELREAKRDLSELESYAQQEGASRSQLLQQFSRRRAALEEAQSNINRLEEETREAKHARATLEVELRDARSDLSELERASESIGISSTQLIQGYNNMQLRLENETMRNSDLESNLELYKTRADEYFSKLEQAEMAVLKASRAEQFARSQAKESEETYSNIVAERKQMDTLVEELQQKTRTYEEKLEDLTADLEGALSSKKRLQHELDDYRSQRAMDIETKQSSMEQTRKKYQTEIASLSNDLEAERANAINAREENTQLRQELEALRSKWDDEVVNKSTWAKEKSRMEATLQELSQSRDEAANAHNDAQSKVVSLLSQVRTLRTSMDDVSAERDMLLKEKRGLQAQLAEAGERLETLARGGSPSMRNAAGMDRELLELRSQLAQEQDRFAAAEGKMKRSDAVANEMQRDVVAERENNVQLHKEKAALEKALKESQLKCVDLETKGYSNASTDVRFLHKRIQELETQLEEHFTARNAEARSVRNVDRAVKDLQTQIDRREKTNTQLSDENSKAKSRIDRLLKTIEEMQASDSDAQLQARRAERDLREERERTLRLERELEGWKALRMERGSARNSPMPMAPLIEGSEYDHSASGNGTVRRESLGLLANGDMNSRGGSGDGLHRKNSNTKGFL